MLETILQIVIIVNVIWFIQWLAYRERREYKEFRAWKKRQPHVDSEPQRVPAPPVDDPDVIILDNYRQAK